ncbi:LysM peptidoglycan-binding domain-containing protein [Lentisphaera profundi]|uniref:LysM peptidoglycan-binding domain-containing protein n=1 Tax=Lentisphaera profundi TaxID=1658616 RepID=A0ABY7VS46_9BACT|nr:LysM peptidoglycan-binding domain-containing protein [Lentisphaera profundi]WDE96040.1 LysM peptidoglycan-binding domain-containing protein [Lentisphaera profundi]
MKIKSFALFIAVLAVHFIVGGVTWVVTRHAGEPTAGEAQKIEQAQNENAESNSSNPPSVNQVVPSPRNSPTVPSTRTKSYVVKSGDRLSVIAGRHGVSITKLMTVNNIKDQNRIFIGQKLTIPLD